ncbi:ATP-binding protein [Streptomyces bicolor]|uniref:ATP-binding protein n=1 Tax=Streptomyces bicolor TaxID=66874 RepID=UPI0004E23734|nr:LuxR family transcriptional regulator [Streptomyces bicolor]
MLYGREDEVAELVGLTDQVRGGTSAALVLRGEAGIGKSSLLAHLEQRAQGMTVLRAVGVEPESDLAFAALLQLLRPVAHHIDTLPEPQAQALQAALGHGGTWQGDRFLTGLAVLSLLAEAAAERPLLCLLDDAHWMDEPSVQALLFAARRLAAEGVALVFAARDEGFDAPGLRELRPGHLGRAEAGILLDALGVDPARRQRIIEEAGGNPLALTEFAAGDDTAFAPVVPLAAPDRVLASFRSRISALPGRTRTMLLIAAADPQAHLAQLLAAAQRLHVGPGDLADAESLRLIEVAGNSVRFRHPLIRSAVYQGAPLASRVAVHRALADTAPTADGGALHRAAAALGPDEAVATAVEAVGARASARGGFAAAANLYRQAARLTPEPTARAPRLTSAAWSAHRAGMAALAGELAEEAGHQAAAGPEGRADRAEAAHVRALALFEQDQASEAVRLLIEAAPDAPAQGAQMMRSAAFYAWHSNDLDMLHHCAAVLARQRERHPVGRAVQGLDRVAAGDFAKGLPLLSRLLDEADRADEDSRSHAITGGLLLGDDTRLRRVTEAETARCRQQGVVGRLPFLLSVLGRLHVYAGEHREALATITEAKALAGAAGLHKRLTQLNHVVARIAAIEGDEIRVRALARPGPAVDGSHGLAALILLDLGLGRYEEVLRRIHEAERQGSWNSMALILACTDAAEAAVRLGDEDRAEHAAQRFASWATASGRPWARATALRIEALLTQDLPLFEQAMQAHHGDASHGGRPFEQARTELVYGEALRRNRRSAQAAVHLRAAAATFDRLGATPWAERARGELRATGTNPAAAQAATCAPAVALTPQELQVVRLAATGMPSREIAAQLFLSPRTVEYHLYKVYPKLGVTSRKELAELDLHG